MGYGENEELKTISCHVCNGLFSIGEDGFGIRRMTNICKWFGRYPETEGQLLAIEIIYVPRTHNSKVDILARTTLKQSSFVVYMNA